MMSKNAKLFLQAGLLVYRLWSRSLYGWDWELIHEALRKAKLRHDRRYNKFQEELL